MTTAIVGTGNIGSRLAANLVAGDQSILVASRSVDSARELADRLGDRATAVTVDEAVDAADVLVLAVWFDTIKELLAKYGDRLNGKIIVDPSNPIAPDGQGGFSKTLPETESAGRTLAAQAPSGARLVKAFGTLSADSLSSAARRTPHRGVAFYATDDDAAGQAVADLIQAAGFDPLKVGGIDQSIRIEVFGDLHEFTVGAVLSLDEAKELV
ncbi:NAD(P)-binding domain-containing protein [Streptomyces albipurpureus]|uniref:NAD(P)-binding domain-containing protein n=1 Tax=Streptomyces albipurpureus TaxID=2897419 RepID=A0ABT0UPA2_9ACTN|nr:NAD(P)-binding domain-containing protein [Streptomyces sp. CWNU-1]